MLTQQYTALMTPLNPKQNGPAVLLVSLLENCVNEFPWIVENFSPVILPPIYLGFKS